MLLYVTLNFEVLLLLQYIISVQDIVQNTSWFIYLDSDNVSMLIYTTHLWNMVLYMQLSGFIHNDHLTLHSQ